MTIAKMLNETDIKIIGKWVPGIAFEDDPKAAEPEPEFKMSIPVSYFAPTTALGPWTTRDREFARERSDDDAADVWLQIRYLRSRWCRRP